MSRVKEANKKVKAAEAALKAAEKVAQEARVEALARKAEEALKKANRAVWEVCRVADWPENLRIAYSDLEKVQDLFATAVLGGLDRLYILNKLDPDRWELDSEDGIYSAHDFTTDEDMIHSISTWCFDQGIEKNAMDEGYQSYRSRIIDAVGEDIAHKALSGYLKGHHDT